LNVRVTLPPLAALNAARSALITARTAVMAMPVGPAAMPGNARIRPAALRNASAQSSMSATLTVIVVTPFVVVDVTAEQPASASRDAADRSAIRRVGCVVIMGLPFKISV